MILKDFPYVRLLFLFGLVGLGLVAFVCLMPIGSSTYPIFNGVDKIEHLLTYLCLSYYFVQLTIKKRYLLVVVFLFLFGVSIEFLQDLTEYRSFDIWDMLANSVGIFLGYLFASENDRFLATYLINK